MIDGLARCARPGCGHVRAAHHAAGFCSTTAVGCACTQFVEPAKPCAECGEPIPGDAWVNLNGRDLHVVQCFGKGLRQLEHLRAQIEILLSPAMPAPVAYKAGKTEIATIVGSRRRAARKGKT